MEDFYENKIDGVVCEIVGLFGVFDGLGGGWAAEYVKHNLFSNQIKHPKFIFDKESVIADAYSQIDPEFLKNKTNRNRDDRIDGVDGEMVGLFGVFDGHGGTKAAKYVKQNMFSNLMKHAKFITDTKLALDSDFLKDESCSSGSTASTAVLLGDHLLVANVGDSRAVICRDGIAKDVSRDHKPDQPDEKQRIEEDGGFIRWAGASRVCGNLAISGAFLKPYLVVDPEIQEEIIDRSLEFLIIASDGLWDVVSSEEAMEMVKLMDGPEEAAETLMQEAYRRESADNITCVVVRFLWPQCGASSSSTTSTSNCVQRNCCMLLSQSSF